MFGCQICGSPEIDSIVRSTQEDGSLLHVACCHQCCSLIRVNDPRTLTETLRFARYGDPGEGNDKVAAFYDRRAASYITRILRPKLQIDRCEPDQLLVLTSTYQPVRDADDEPLPF